MRDVEDRNSDEVALVSTPLVTRKGAGKSADQVGVVFAMPFGSCYSKFGKCVRNITVSALDVSASNRENSRVALVTYFPARGA